MANGEIDPDEEPTTDEVILMVWRMRKNMIDRQVTSELAALFRRIIELEKKVEAQGRASADTHSRTLGSMPIG